MYSEAYETGGRGGEEGRKGHGGGMGGRRVAEYKAWGRQGSINICLVRMFEPWLPRVHDVFEVSIGLSERLRSLNIYPLVISQEDHDGHED